MMHRRTITTSVSAVSTSPPGRPPRSPAAALLASATAPAAAPGSTARSASRSTRGAPSRSSWCVGRPRTLASRHPADGTPAWHMDYSGHSIRRVEIATGATTTLAGSGSLGFRDGAGGSAQFYYPGGIAIDPSGTFALVGVRRPPPYPRIPPSRRRHTRLAHGVGAAPVSSAARPPVHELFLSDRGNHRIRRVDIATGATTTLAGSGTGGFRNGAGGSAQFRYPRGVAIEPSGGYALVVVRVPLDQNNNRIRRVDIATGATTTLAGSGTYGYLNGAGGSARFRYPGGVAIDPTGGFAL
eukprot:scaffold37319_cov52-Phaeocystis_antarctica.AAC.2